jgi:hypothetical protein
VKLIGVGYEPLLVAKQVVAGLCYIFVCNAKIVVPGAREYAAAVRVYLPISGAPEIKVVQIGNPHFAMGAYGTFEAVGDEEKKALEEAAGVGTGFEPLLVATQIVAGRNLLFAANAKTVYPNAPKYPVFITVFAPATGKPQISKVTDAWKYV